MPAAGAEKGEIGVPRRQDDGLVIRFMLIAVGHYAHGDYQGTNEKR